MITSRCVLFVSNNFFSQLSKTFACVCMYLYGHHLDMFRLTQLWFWSNYFPIKHFFRSLSAFFPCSFFWTLFLGDFYVHAPGSRLPRTRNTIPDRSLVSCSKIQLRLNHTFFSSVTWNVSLFVCWNFLYFLLFKNYFCWFGIYFCSHTKLCIS